MTVLLGLQAHGPADYLSGWTVIWGVGHNLSGMLNHTGIGEGTYLPASRGRWTTLLVGEGEVLDDDGDPATMALL